MRLPERIPKSRIHRGNSEHRQPKGTTVLRLAEHRLMRRADRGDLCPDNERLQLMLDEGATSIRAPRLAQNLPHRLLSHPPPCGG